MSESHSRVVALLTLLAINGGLTRRPRCCFAYKIKPIALLLFFLPALHSEESREVARSLATHLARHNWGAYSQAMLLFCLLKPIAILPFLLPSPSPSSDRKVPKNFLQTYKILAEDFVTYHLSWFCLSSCMFW